MSFSYKLISHKGEKFPDGQQLLVAHLRGVTDIALKLHKSHGINEELEEVIRIICMCHDFGKASTYFQKYLEDGHGSELKTHGEISAFFTYYMLPEKYKLYGFLCVKRHHGKMNNAVDTFIPDKEKLKKQAQAIKSNIKELEAIYSTELSDFFDKMQDDKYLNSPQRQFGKSAGKFKVEDIILVEYLWSLLLTGDKTQIIRGEAYQNKQCFKEEHVSSYKKLIREKLIKEKPGIQNTELFSIRERIYNEILSTINSLDIKNKHKLSVNVPTGTGKTLGVYGAAFRLAERIYNESNGAVLPSIIYTLPYTSIIDQNHDELEKIMKHNNIPQFEDLILKHHSMTELRYRTSEADEYKDYDARFCVENWQSTIITTTFVQIFNTIFKTGINGIGSRFHKLAGSIIILDEVQAVDPKYYKIIEQFFDILCNKYNTYVILVTATKPVLLEGQELVANNELYFNSLDRIRIENHTDKGIYLREFCGIVEADIRENDDKSYLIVLNTIKTSMETTKYLRDAFKGKREVLYLSTEIYPKRRMELINMIKNDTHKKYIVVSTQLIEAGVDVDFDIVYRDFCIMDSINQTGGRANRNAIK
ncbi:MAG: CRISPR-associated helicase Cas3', partial [Lutisporaceae bacterium]